MILILKKKRDEVSAAHMQNGKEGPVTTPEQQEGGSSKSCSVTICEPPAAAPEVPS